jgi:hypothetical protein
MMETSFFGNFRVNDPITIDLFRRGGNENVIENLGNFEDYKEENGPFDPLSGR